MIVLGIDPGNTHSGVVRYDTEARRVLMSDKAASTADVLDGWIDGTHAEDGELVAIERMQSYGIAGGDLLETARVSGRFEQRALDRGLRVVMLYRREVLRELDVTGKGSRDVLVRQRMIEEHGGTKRAAVGVKAAQGPLYGIAGHAWQALGLAVAAAQQEERR